MDGKYVTLLVIINCVWYATVISQPNDVNCYSFGGLSFTKDVYVLDSATPVAGCKDRCSVKDVTYYGIRWITGDTVSCYCIQSGHMTSRSDCPHRCGDGKCGGPEGVSVYYVCTHNHWGDNCRNECSCRGGNRCDKSNGTCIIGCVGCNSQPCNPGDWGIDCESSCHCRGSDVCARDTGLCPSGCQSSWYGPACNKRQPSESAGCFPREIINQNVESHSVIHASQSGSYKSMCQDTCLGENTSFFNLLELTDGQVICNCLGSLPLDSQIPCSSARALSVPGLPDSEEVFTVCPSGSYSNDGQSCNSFCNCLEDINNSGTCTFDGTKTVCLLCPPGWIGDFCNEDVDECTGGAHSCETSCVNT